MTTTIRAATAEDADAVARIWVAGWRDGHLGLVPEELVAMRTPESFTARAAARVADTTVAAGGHATAWLAVNPGNARARVFYERRGWRDEGDLEYPAATAGGTFVVTCRRYTRATR